MEKQILFTFDYELFLGEASGSVEDCLLKPTNELITIFDKYNLKAIFFVDTTYLLRLKEIVNKYSKAKNDYERIIEQLILLLNKGHYLFPHIHPHWLEAEYNVVTNEWSLCNTKKYRFHSISDEEKKYLFEHSFLIINELLRKIDIISTYEINAYRAGGWSIQPFTTFKPFFEQYNIVHDFSVLSSFKLVSNTANYDFLDAPTKGIYQFSDVIVKEDNLGQFTEWTISSITMPKVVNFFASLLKKILWKFSTRSSGRSAITIAKERIESNLEMMSIELMTVFHLFPYLKSINNRNFIQFISHPKMIKKHNILAFKILLAIVSKYYKLETDYKKIHEKYQA